MDNILETAVNLACDAHKDQLYGDQPYETHLRMVTGVLWLFGIVSDEMMAAGWLHDALEDTKLTKDEIAAQCGERVAEIVWRVTDEPGANRKERKLKTYPKTRQDQDALILKLADRIANVKHCLRTNSGLLSMYRKEHATFQRELRPACTTTEAAAMWAWLDEHLSS